MPEAVRREGWKVKIRDAERLEEPHVTTIRKLDAWRLSLRTGKFLEEGHGWRQIDKRVRPAIVEQWKMLRAQWDACYPHNPICGEADEQDD